MSNNSDNSAIVNGCLGGFFVMVIASCLLYALVNGWADKTPTQYSETSTPEGDYVNSRFRQEGYSKKDAATATEAIIRFQRAQDAKKKGR